MSWVQDKWNLLPVQNNLSIEPIVKNQKLV
jgi:hypothetical protein